MPTPWKDLKYIEKNCLHCNCIFKTKKKKVRFCSRTCGQKARSKESRIKAVALNIDAWKRNRCNPEGVKSLLDLSLRTVHKIFKRMGVKCSRCSWNEGTCDIHHINGKKIPDPHNNKNLCVLCPNCHRLFHNKKIKKEELINLDDYIGETWKDFYYGRTAAKKPKIKLKKERPQKFSPNKEILEKQILELPITEIAKIYGVSDNGIRVKCKKLGIEIPKNRYGIWIKGKKKEDWGKWNIESQINSLPGCS